MDQRHNTTSSTLHVKQRQTKFLNNRIECDHAPIEKLVVATGGFKQLNRAWLMLQGFETLRQLNKGQFDDGLRFAVPLPSFENAFGFLLLIYIFKFKLQSGSISRITCSHDQTMTANIFYTN